ncbi:MAG: ankyrin repeat domain-containing protein [Acidobacteria bacterium]|nr:ankyrin repeat domain-containing protein [Acidobacteriota bacterium]
MPINVRCLTILSLLATFCAPAQQADRLIQAVVAGHSLGNEPKGIAALEALLAEGLDVNAADSAGWTALMQACLEGRPRIVALLVKHGADVNASQAKFGTPLMIASGLSIVRRRVENIEKRGLPESWKAQELAAPLEIATILVQAGARVSAQHHDGRTALMNAAQLGWTDLVRFLLDSGADVSLRDAEGRSAMDYVSSTRAAEIEQLLVAAGAPQRSGKSGRLVCDAQLRLADLGYSDTVVDCIEGNSLRDGLLSFQRAENLEATGRLDPATIAALGF